MKKSTIIKADPGWFLLFYREEGEFREKQFDHIPIVAWKVKHVKPEIGESHIYSEPVVPMLQGRSTSADVGAFIKDPFGGIWHMDHGAACAMTEDGAKELAEDILTLTKNQKSRTQLDDE